MTSRDRLIILGLTALALLAAGWLLVVSPERKEAAQLATQVSAAKTQLATAEGQVANARGDQARYSAAYASIVSLGKAVPPDQEVPSLIYQLAQASNHKNVDFSSIVSGSGSGAGASAGASATPAAGGSATPGAATASFTQMPFTFVFNGTFPDLYHLFQQLNRFIVRTTSGGVRVSGRLLTIQAVKLAPATGTGVEQAAGKRASEQLTGTITATAYVLPAAQGLTGGATPASPTPATVPASSSPGASSPAAPAIARVTP
jgi:hypothetical protein